MQLPPVITPVFQRRIPPIMKYQELPAHCGIVVATNQNAPPFGREISIIGGNVDDTVALTHVPTDSAGRISTPDGKSYDSRYPWCAVLTPRYDTDADPQSGQ